MAQRTSTGSWLFGGVLATLFAVVRFSTLLIIELIAAMLVYIYLALYDIQLFGYLVRVARDLLDIFARGIEGFFPASANQAYGTLIGEFGPKSFRLLLIGLAVGAFIRFLTWAVVRLIAAGRR